MGNYLYCQLYFLALRHRAFPCCCVERKQEYPLCSIKLCCLSQAAHKDTAGENQDQARRSINWVGYATTCCKTYLYVTLQNTSPATSSRDVSRAYRKGRQSLTVLTYIVGATNQATHDYEIGPIANDKKSNYQSTCFQKERLENGLPGTGYEKGHVEARR